MADLAGSRFLSEGLSEIYFDLRQQDTAYLSSYYLIDKNIAS